MTDVPLLDAIVNPFIEGAKRDDFNGIGASALLRLQPNPETLRASLSALVRDGQVTAVFSRLSVNIHIKRFPDHPVEEQLKLLIDEPLEAFCLYPTASVVGPRVDQADSPVNHRRQISLNLRAQREDHLARRPGHAARPGSFEGRETDCGIEGCGDRRCR